MASKSQTQEKNELNQLIDEQNYDEIFQKFLEIRKEMLGEKGSLHFCQEYEKLFEVFAKTKENELRLLAKCNELNEQTEENKKKIENTIEMCVTNRQVINGLREELAAAKTLVKNAQENEAEAHTLSKNIKQQYNELYEIINEGGSGSSSTPTDFLKKKEDMTKQLQLKGLELDQAQTKINSLQVDISSLEKINEELTKTNKKLENVLAAEETEKQRELRKKEKLERELKQAKDDIVNLNKDLEEEKKVLKETKSELNKEQQLLKENKNAFDKYTKDINTQNDNVKKLEKELADQEVEYSRLKNDLQYKVNELKIKEDDLKVLRVELKNGKLNQNKLTHKIKSIEDQKNVVVKQLEIQKNETTSLEKEITYYKLQIEMMKKDLSDKGASKDLQKLLAKPKNKSLDEGKLKNIKNVFKDEKAFAEKKYDNLKTEMKFVLVENKKLKNNLRVLERVNNEKLKCTEKLDQQAKRLKEQSMNFKLTYAESEKKGSDMKNEIKELNSKLEAIRVEKNLISRGALEAKAEAYEMRQQANLVNHQVDQLREQTSFKDATLIKEKYENVQLMKNIDNYRDQVSKYKSQILEFQKKIKKEEQENTTLKKEIAETEKDLKKCNKEKQQVISEKNTLSSQLMRRNDEICLLFEKVKLLEDTLNRGMLVYNRRLDDISILKGEIKRLECENLYMSKGLETMEDNRREIFKIQQENLEARTKVKVLEDELQNPLNIHRWRKLKGNDPNQFEMILKMQWLQQRLIKKTEDVIKKEKEIKEINILFEELKKIMTRQPGVETLDELMQTRSCLNKTRDKVKSLTAEVKVYKDLTEKVRLEKEKEVGELKKKYQKLKLQKEFGVDSCITPFIMPQDFKKDEAEENEETV